VLLALFGLSAGAQEAGNVDPGVLEARIAALEKQLAKVKAAAGSTAPESGSEAAPVKAESDGRRLQFETVDKAFSFQFGGRVQADAVFHDADHTDLGDGTGIRRLFLDVRGTIFEDWNYRFQYDF